MWLVPASLPALVAATGTTKPLGPVIVGVLRAVPDTPFLVGSFCRNVTSVFKPGVPAMFAVPTANCNVVVVSGLTLVTCGSMPELPEVHPNSAPPAIIDKARRIDGFFINPP